MISNSIKIRPSLINQKYSFVKDFSESVFSEIMMQVTSEFMNDLSSIAKDKVDDKRFNIYKNSIKARQISKNQWTIYIDDIDRFANTSFGGFMSSGESIEKGIGPFDMKKGFLFFGNPKIAKDGTIYKIIPIKGKNELARTSEDVATSKDRQLAKKISIANHVVAKKQNSKQIKNSISTATITGNIPNNLRGISRAISDFSSKVISKTKFRTVTSKSKPSSWWHPGFKGVNGIQKINRDIDRYVDNAMERIMEI